MTIGFITVAYLKTIIQESQKLVCLFLDTVQWRIQTFRWRGGRSSRPWDKGGWGGGRSRKKNFLAVHSHFRSHYLGKFSHLTLKLSSVYLQHSFLSGYFRVCQGTITSTLDAYSHLWSKGKRVRFPNFQLKMFKNWQSFLCYWWW